MVIENAITGTIDFFHIDALSAAAPVKIAVNLQLTLIAGAHSIGRSPLRVSYGREIAKTGTLFTEPIKATTDSRV